MGTNWRTAMLAALMGLLTAGCSSWEIQGDACVLERSDEVVQRVVNYADPELCGRIQMPRGPDYVRVPHPDD